jgi:hypothetical protein
MLFKGNRSTSGRTQQRPTNSIHRAIPTQVASRTGKPTPTPGIHNPSITPSMLITLRPSMRGNSQQRQTSKERRRETKNSPHTCSCQSSTSSNLSTRNSMGGSSSTRCITQSARRVLAAREARARSRGRWIRLKGTLWHPPLRLSC